MNKILLIEDDSFLAQMYASKLQLANFEVIVASDGEKGLQLAKKNKPNLIVLDLLLPKKDGFAVLTEIKQDRALVKIPVLILSNLSQREEVKRCFELGAADYLIKAHTIPSEVVLTIQELLKQS